MSLEGSWHVGGSVNDPADTLLMQDLQQRKYEAVATQEERSGHADAAAAPPDPEQEESPSRTGHGEDEARTRFLRVLFPCLLCITFTAYTLLRRYTEGILKEKHTSASVTPRAPAAPLALSAEAS